MISARLFRMVEAWEIRPGFPQAGASSEGQRATTGPSRFGPRRVLANRPVQGLGNGRSQAAMTLAVSGQLKDLRGFAAPLTAVEYSGMK
jgi:hypothetical protein